MTLSLTALARAGLLNGFATFMNDGGGTATLVLFQTNLTLASFSLNATPFGTAALDSIILTNTAPPLTSTAAASGTVNGFRLTSEGSVAGLTGTISAVGGGGDIELPSLTVTAAATQRLNAFVLRMASDGTLNVEASLTLQ